MLFNFLSFFFVRPPNHKREASSWRLFVCCKRIVSYTALVLLTYPLMKHIFQNYIYKCYLAWIFHSLHPLSRLMHISAYKSAYIFIFMSLLPSLPCRAFGFSTNKRKLKSKKNTHGWKRSVTPVHISEHSEPMGESEWRFARYHRSQWVKLWNWIPGRLGRDIPMTSAKHTQRVPRCPSWLLENCRSQQSEVVGF